MSNNIILKSLANGFLTLIIFALIGTLMKGKIGRASCRERV